MPPSPEFGYQPLLPSGTDGTPYRRLTTDGVATVGAGGRTFLEVSPDALALLTETAMHDIAHYLRPAHLAQLRRILDDPEASPNDRFVFFDLRGYQREVEQRLGPSGVQALEERTLRDVG